MYLYKIKLKNNMKKIFFMALVAVLFASCGKENQDEFFHQQYYYYGDKKVDITLDPCYVAVKLKSCDSAQSEIIADKLAAYGESYKDKKADGVFVVVNLADKKDQYRNFVDFCRTIDEVSMCTPYLGRINDDFLCWGTTVMLKFRESPSYEKLNLWAKRFGATVKEIGTDYYGLYLNDIDAFKALEVANYIAETGLVEFAVSDRFFIIHQD